MTEFEELVAGKLKMIEQRLSALEQRTVGMVTLGPTEKTEFELGAEARELDRKIKAILTAAKAGRPVDPKDGIALDIPPVDRSCRVLVDGSPVPEDGSHLETTAGGQQKDYVVLCDAERAKGFVRPVRRTYKHLKCGSTTTMSQSIAETYARDPGFYSGTFCYGCGAHFPIETYGQIGEFVWEDGTKVGL
jgi:hypothetical protein